MKPFVKRGLWGGIALVAIVLVVLLLRRGDSAEAAAASPGGGRGERQAVAVEVAPVERGRIREVRNLTGTLSPGAQFALAPKVTGRLTELRVDIGDVVRRGEVVAILDAEEAVQQLAQAEAEKQIAEASLEEAESALLLARREVERVRLLRERNISSQADLETAEAQLQTQEARLRVARATVAQREAAAENTRLRLSHTQVRADWSGGDDTRWVGERFADEGANVTANEPLVSVVALDVLRAVVFVTERDYVRLSVGQTAEITVDAFPGERFPARIARLAPVFRETSRQARVELEVPNPGQRLRPGMFARISLELGRAEDAVIIPRDAIVRRNGTSGVFQVTEENRAQFVEVRSGIFEGNRAQVLEPALTGNVVVLGQNQLTEGAAVRVARTQVEGRFAAEGGRR